MSRSKHSEAQMIAAVNQMKDGRKAEDAAWEVGVSTHTIYASKAKYRAMDVREAQKAKRFTRELQLQTVVIFGGTSQPPSAMQGKSFLPLAEGKKTSWRKDWLYEYYEYPGFEDVRPCRGVRTSRYKYIEFFLAPKEYELYDLETDPGEMHNLYGKPGYDELTRHLQDRMEELRKQTDDHYEYQPTGLPLHPGDRRTKPVR